VGWTIKKVPFHVIVELIT